MRAKEYVVLSAAVEEGIFRGYRRAHKHVDNPSEESILSAVYESVMGSICEVFKFDDAGDDNGNG